MPVEADSPAIPLAGLFLVGQGMVGGRKWTGGESGKGIVAGGFADASADYVASEVLSATGMSGTVSNSLARAVLGAGLSNYGGAVPQNRAMARGIMYGVASDAITDLGADLGSLIGDVSAERSNATRVTSRAQTQPATSRMTGGRSGGGLTF